MSVALNTIYFKRPRVSTLVCLHVRAMQGLSAKTSGRGKREQAPLGVRASAKKRSGYSNPVSTGADTSHHSLIGCSDNGMRARRVNSVRTPYPSVVRNETSHAITGHEAKREHRGHKLNELDHPTPPSSSLLHCSTTKVRQAGRTICRKFMRSRWNEALFGSGAWTISPRPSLPNPEGGAAPGRPEPSA